MDTQENFDINNLQGRQLWQLSCAEYIALMRYILMPVVTLTPPDASAPPKQAFGMTQLAKALGCFASFLYGIRHNIEDFDSAIISQIGRKPVFDVEIARKLANDYMTRMRELRQSSLPE